MYEHPATSPSTAQGAPSKNRSSPQQRKARHRRIAQALNSAGRGIEESPKPPNSARRAIEESLKPLNRAGLKPLQSTGRPGRVTQALDQPRQACRAGGFNRPVTIIHHRKALLGWVLGIAGIAAYLSSLFSPVDTIFVSKEEHPD